MPSNLVSPVMVGRQADLGALRDAWGQAREGAPVTVLVLGGAGIGKSRLVHEFIDEVGDSGARVLTGHCVRLDGGGDPFAPLLDMIRTLAVFMTREELRWLLGPALSGLALLIPELATVAEGPPEADPDPGQLLELLADVVGRLGRAAPTVLVFEDIHWADAATLELLACVVRQTTDGRLLLLLTARPGEAAANQPFNRIYERWLRERLVRDLPLSPLACAEVGAQIEAIAGESPDQQTVLTIAARSRGIPLFVEELLGAAGVSRVHPSQVPHSVRDALLSRVEQLSADAQLTLLAVSAAVRPVPEDLLATVTSLPDARLGAALREAVDGQLLVVDDRVPGYRFRHVLASAAIHDELGDEDRIRLHRAYAQALEEGRGSRVGQLDRSAVLAHHWMAAGDWSRALVAAVRAGRSAVSAATPAAALRYLELALELWDKVPRAAALTGLTHPDLLTMTAEAAGWAGAAERALTLIDQAFAEVGAGATVQRLAPLVMRRSTLLRELGREEEGLVALLGIVEQLPDAPSDVAAKVMACYGEALVHLDRCERLAEVAAETLRIAEEAGEHQAQLQAQHLQAVALIEEGDMEAALGLMVLTARQAREASYPDLATRVELSLTDLQMLLCRYGEAVTTAQEGLAYTERVGLGSTLGVIHRLNLGDSLLRLGRWREAFAQLNTSGHAAGVFWGAIALIRAELRLLTGDLDGAADDLIEARQRLRSSRAAQYALSVARIDAELALADCDFDTARELVEHALTQTGRDDGPRYRWPLVSLGMRIEADAVRGARCPRGPVDRSERWLAVLVGEVERLAVRSPNDDGHHALARAEYARLRGTAGPDDWALAVAAVREMNNRHVLAYALYRSAEALQADAALPAAAAAAAEAASLAASMGAAPLGAAINALRLSLI
ncbi:MAG TPA: AAA family ATPase [Solirubrobacteraceae bacterium]|nr:AAA family ATPase [Solirubrobacteraceae bacterium]